MAGGVFGALAKNVSPKSICDPWAGTGFLVEVLRDACQPKEPSPQSAKNACYFFNRLEREGARFVSYHFTDHPELKGQFIEATEAISFLTQV